MKIFFILALLSLSLTASSSFALIDTCSKSYEKLQLQQLMLNPCRELLRQQCRTVTLPFAWLHMYQLSSCEVMRQQCCQQLRQIAPQCCCQAICTMVQAIMQQQLQQAEFSGGYLDQTQAQAQEALNMPSMCGIYSTYCNIPCSITAVAGGRY